MGVLFPSGFIFLGYYYTLDIEWFWMFHERKSRPLFHHICYWKSKDFISWWMIETFFRGWKHVYNMDGKCMHKEVAEFIFSDSCRRIKKLLLYGKGLSFHKIGGGSAKKKQIRWLCFLLCTRLALSFHKIGGGSAVEKKKPSAFYFPLPSLALSLPTIWLTNKKP